LTFKFLLIEAAICSIILQLLNQLTLLKSTRGKAVFTIIYLLLPNQPECLFLAGLVQPILMFESEARAILYTYFDAPFMCFLLR